MQETRAPAKVERKAELFQPHQTLDLERRGKGLGELNDYEDGTYNSAKEFVFNIDPSLLIDPRLVKISQVIGEGPNSIVFEGLYKSKPVAVKILQPTRMSAVSIECKEKFQREVTLLSKVKHENIVKFIGACVEPTMVIITELMRGGTLQKYLWSVRPRTLEQKLAISFALEISRVMEYLHAKGIIHRDLKPSNLLLTEDRKHITLADFGHAREEISGEMTCESGTYRWMAPELFSIDPLPIGEKKKYDHKVDVYSFSIVLWELLTNRTPFKGRNNVMAAYATAKKVRPSLDEIPTDFIPLLQSCWEEDPKNRPEFMEIIIYLSNFFPDEVKPSTKVVGIEHPQSNMKGDSSNTPTHPLMNEPEEKVKKCRRSSFGFLGCFDSCFFN